LSDRRVNRHRVYFDFWKLPRTFNTAAGETLKAYVPAIVAIRMQYVAKMVGRIWRD